MSWKLSKILTYSALGAALIGTGISLKANDYQVDSIGIVRLSRAAVTVFEVSAIYNKHLYRRGLSPESEEYEQIKSYCHQQAAERLLKLCCVNKGVFIKVGQHVAALDYLLPPEYVQTMKVLHNNAPRNTMDDIYKVLREDLKKEPLEIFLKIEEEPLGTASLAQVHKATLKDGSIVAVKVQHPYVMGNATVDMKTMEVLVKIVSWVFPDFKFNWLVNETKKNIPQELNFQLEGHNAEKLAKMFKHLHWLKVPTIRWDLTTPRVLTMEFVEGGQVNDVKYITDNKINPFEVSDKLGQLYSNMIFLNGFVHSDPHPGNILVKKTEKGDCDIVLLDHGLYATLTNKFRVEYALLWLSILDRDKKAMRAHCKKLGIEGDMYGIFACMVTGRTWETIMEGIDKNRPSQNEKEKMQKVLPFILAKVAGILDSVDRQMLLILKTNDLIRGIEHTLNTSSRMSAFKVMSECCVRSVYKEKLNDTQNRLVRFKLLATQYWALFKIQVYYTFIGLGNICSNLRYYTQKSLHILER